MSERTREWMRRVRALGDVGAHRRLSPVTRVRVRVLSSESGWCGVSREVGAVPVVMHTTQRGACLMGD